MGTIKNKSSLYVLCHKWFFNNVLAISISCHDETYFSHFLLIDACSQEHFNLFDFPTITNNTKTMVTPGSCVKFSRNWKVQFSLLGYAQNNHKSLLLEGRNQSAINLKPYWVIKRDLCLQNAQFNKKIVEHFVLT